MPGIIERSLRASVQMQKEGLGTAQIILIGLPRSGRFQQRSFDFGAVHMSREDGHDRACYLVLDGEHVVKLAFVTLGPAMTTGRRVDELRRDADAVTNPSDATLQHIAYGEFAPDLPNVDRFALVLKA